MPWSSPAFRGSQRHHRGHVRRQRLKKRRRPSNPGGNSGDMWVSLEMGDPKSWWMDLRGYHHLGGLLFVFTCLNHEPVKQPAFSPPRLAGLSHKSIARPTPRPPGSEMTQCTSSALVECSQDLLMQPSSLHVSYRRMEIGRNLPSYWHPPNSTSSPNFPPDQPEPSDSPFKG